MRVSGEGYQFVQVDASFFLMPRYSTSGYNAQETYFGHFLLFFSPVAFRGRRPRIHKGSENSFLNNSACSSLKMATKSVAKAAMKRDWKDKARDRVGAVSLSADTPSWYNSLQIMLPFFLHSLRPCDERSITFRVPPQDFALWAKSLRRQQKIVFFSIHKNKYA